MPSHTDEERQKNAEKFKNISEADLKEQLTQEKASDILRGKKKGAVLSGGETPQQFKFFGAVAGGEKPRQ